MANQINQAMKTEAVTREQVMELARILPLEKLVRWYEYGLFIQSYPLAIPAAQASEADEAQLRQEFGAWEAASDEDWLKLEQKLAEVA